MTHDPLQPLTPEEGGLHGDIPNTPEMRAWFQELGEKAQTATHDPLCPIQPPVVGSGSTDPAIRTMPESAGVPCQCSLIAKVRAHHRRGVMWCVACDLPFDRAGGCCPTCGLRGR